jgi:hypothetical protein
MVTSEIAQVILARCDEGAYYDTTNTFCAFFEDAQEELAIQQAAYLSGKPLYNHEGIATYVVKRPVLKPYHTNERVCKCGHGRPVMQGHAVCGRCEVEHYKKLGLWDFKYGDEHINF